jgi:hypothetical protein
VIQNDDQLRGTSEALCLVQATLAALHRRKAGVHPARFALMAEPILDELHRLRAEIDEYIGLSDAEHAVAAVGSKASEPVSGGT